VGRGRGRSGLLLPLVDRSSDPFTDQFSIIEDSGLPRVWQSIDLYCPDLIRL